MGPPSDAPTTVLRLEGREALPLLDRISTRRLLDLEPGQARWAPFCDFRGRLLHRALVAVTGDCAVWLLRDDAPGLGLAAALNAHVFRENIRIGLGHERWAARLAAAPDGGDPGMVERDGAPVAVPAGDGLRMELVEPGAPSPEPLAEPARILAGRPRHGHEIAQEFTPFEVNLGNEVHLAKGCYTGQEALQRRVTYDSVRRRLARVAGGGAVPAVPQAVALGSEAAGVLTSAAAERSTGGWIGLAVLKPEACAAGAVPELERGGTLTRIEPFEIRPPEGRA